jgi:hypothetical protein
MGRPRKNRVSEYSTLLADELLHQVSQAVTRALAEQQRLYLLEVAKLRSEVRALSRQLEQALRKQRLRPAPVWDVGSRAAPGDRRRTRTIGSRPSKHASSPGPNRHRSGSATRPREPRGLRAGDPQRLRLEPRGCAHRGVGGGLSNPLRTDPRDRGHRRSNGAPSGR